MRSNGLMFFGAVLTILMVVLSIWVAQHAVPLARTWEHPIPALWAFRVGALALFSAAQVVILTLVIGVAWEPTRQVAWLGRGATVCFTLSLVTAITLGLLGR